MCKIIIFYRPKSCPKKVRLTKLFQRTLDIRLKEAKEMTDAILEGKQILLEFNTKVEANFFTEEAQELGAICIFLL